MHKQFALELKNSTKIMLRLEGANAGTKRYRSRLTVNAEINGDYETRLFQKIIFRIRDKYLCN